MAKTSPTSIRFEEDQLKFIKEKEKLESPQKVVNFLLNQYWWQHNYRPIPVERIVESGKTTSTAKGVQKYLNEISELQFPDEFRKMSSQIEADEHLTKKEKDLLLLNMRKSTL